jgi:hypothetical protein
VAAPNLQAQGATATGVTTGVPSIAIPTHQADDILVVTAIIWAPNTTTPDAAQIPTPSGWTLLSTQIPQPAASPRNGWLACFWKRATGAGTTVTLTRGTGWDTGNDTCFNGRAYVIRGCIATGDPWDAVAMSIARTIANQACAAVTVSGAERMVVQFGCSTDNAAFAMTSAGWTIGTEDDDAGGTDSAFQTARKDNVSASTTADAMTCAAPAQGFYGFFGVSFKPPVAAIAGELSKAVAIALSAAGAVLVQGTLNTALALSLSAAGTIPAQGVLSQEVPLSLSATGAVTDAGVVGDLSQALALTLSADGVVLVQGSLASTVVVGVTADGDVLIAGSLAQVLPLSLVADGGVITGGAVQQDLPLSLDGTGVVLVTGALSSTLLFQLGGSGGEPAGYAIARARRLYRFKYRG